MTTNIWRISRVLDATGKCRTGLYNDIKHGLFTQPVKLGPRASGWPAHEVDSIRSAWIAGWDTTRIRELVQMLETARQTSANRVIAEAVRAHG